MKNSLFFLKTGLRAMIIATAILGGAAPAFAQIAVAQGDASAGEQVFKRCQGCHKVGADARNAVGPVLNDVFGRVAGTFEGYRYGKGIVAAGEAGLVWDAPQIVDYLAGPKAFLRAYLNDNTARAKMSFKLPDEQARWDVVAYLATFSTAPAQ